MIYLDTPADPDSAKASYKNGILTLELDKKQKRKERRCRSTRWIDQELD
ncbi:Hsp20/alpha crystallin family protein [Methanothrix sp.]|nr:Hsp20/alpha crystallin family protein [Methanothrix sp.]